MSALIQEPNSYRWTAHPARERPGRAAIGLAVIGGIAAAAYLSFGWEWSITSALVLILSLNRFFLPSRFEMNNERITARYPLRSKTLHWKDVRRLASDANGGYLSTRSRRSLMDPSSGMHLLFGGDAARREYIIGFIRQRRAPGVQAPADEIASQISSSSTHSHLPAMAAGDSACRD